MEGGEPSRKELEDKALKVRNAQEAAQAPGASEREKADLKLMEQELLAEQQKRRRQEPAGSKKPKKPTGLSDRMDSKLDSALKDSFPGSDPVSFLEATPVKEGDRDLTPVKVNDQESPGGRGTKPK